MPDRHYVILIHGTWANPIDGEPHWAVLGSAGSPTFASKLNDRLEAYGVGRAVGRTTGDVSATFRWSGENDHSARLQAGSSLFELITSIEAADPQARIHIVAHSHGGNVALKAVELYLYELRQRAMRFSFSLWGQKPNVKEKDHTLALRDAWLEAKLPIAKFDLAIEEVSAIAARVRSDRIADNGLHNTDKDLAEEAMRHQVLLDHEEARNRFSSPTSPRPDFYDHMLQHRGISTGSSADIWMTGAGTNRLGRLVLMGTPFMYKYWRPASTRIRQHVSTIVEIPAFAAIFATIFYLVGMFIWGFLWLLLGLTFGLLRTPILNPLSWNMWVLAVLFTLAALIGFAIAKDMFRHRNFNYYFSPPEFQTPNESASLKKSAPIQTLVLNASYLDEVLLALSAEPVVFGMMFPRIQALLSPPRFRTTRAHGAPEGMLTDILLICGRYMWASSMWVLSVLFAPLRRIVSGILNRTLIKVIQSTTFGLPPVEFQAASVRATSLIHEPALAVTEVNVAKLMLRTPSEASDLTHGSPTNQSYTFLSNSAERHKLIGESFLWPKVEQHLTAIARQHRHIEGFSEDKIREETQLIVLTLEQQVKDFLATVGLSHSRYYTNEVLIDAIARYIASGSVSDAIAGAKS